MARIRSTLPGQWTDEDFVQMSPLARLLTLAIRNEADDQGVFEWKPVTIKMRLMPNDNTDVIALLGEMEANNQVLRFEHGGRQYGAIRNFRRFQRPKKPNSVHFLPDEFRTYVGLGADGSEPPDVDDDEVPHQFPTGSEKPPQREEVGGRREEGTKKDDDVERVRALADQVRGMVSPDGSQLHPNWGVADVAVRRWLHNGCTPDDIIAGVRVAMARNRDAPLPVSPAFFDRTIAEAVEDRVKPLPAVERRAAAGVAAVQPRAEEGHDDDVWARLWNAGKRNFGSLRDAQRLRRMAAAGLIEPDDDYRLRTGEPLAERRRSA